MQIGDGGDPSICGECHGDTVVKLVAPIDDLVKQLMHATVSIDGDFDVGCNVRDAAVERLERYGWQPIETAPKDETTIVATRNEAGHRSYTLIFWSIMDHEWAGYTAEEEKRLVKFQPTHWMPLPAAPTNG